MEQHQPIKRPDQTSGTTYKFKTPSNSSSYYVTINNIEIDNQLRPIELFINTKDLNNYSWLVGISRLISAILRQKEHPKFILDELKHIHDPNGGWFDNGKYKPSILANIGYILEEHMVNIGYLKEKE